jgi:hypothetical protein
MTLQTFLKELITEQPLRCGISQITDRELFYGNIMIGGDMDILNRFLKTNSFWLLGLFVVGVLVYSCGASKEEKLYLNQLKNIYPDYDFSLTDPVIGLELTVEIYNTQLDSSKAVALYKQFKKPLHDYSIANWVYMIVNRNGKQLFILRENPSEEIVFIDRIDR